MKGFDRSPNPVLRLVHTAETAPEEWGWFCGHCAAPSSGGQAPSPGGRVCASCGFGVMLEARSDIVPKPRDAFLIVDSALSVQGMSREAERLLDVSEEAAVHRPVAELLQTADAEARGRLGFAGAVAEAVAGAEDPMHAFVRPWNTFGVRMRAKIAPCGPPRAALIVLESGTPGLRAVRPE